jgi:hypothetical protein
MVKRQVQQPLMSYRDTDGQWRHALSGEDVDVHPEHAADFDKLNWPDSPPPRKRGPAAAEPSPTSRRTVKKQAAKAAGRQPTPRK